MSILKNQDIQGALESSICFAIMATQGVFNELFGNEIAEGRVIRNPYYCRG